MMTEIMTLICCMVGGELCSTMAGRQQSLSMRSAQSSRAYNTNILIGTLSN